MGFLIVLVVGFVLLWLFVVLPQRRRAAAHQRMLAALDVGDEIVTAGGLYGTVTALEEDDLRLEIAPGVEVRVARGAVAARTELESELLEAAEAVEDAPGERSGDEIRG